VYYSQSNILSVCLHSSAASPPAAATHSNLFLCLFPGTALRQHHQMQQIILNTFFCLFAFTASQHRRQQQQGQPAERRL
jgi:hypothetical protein